MSWPGTFTIIAVALPAASFSKARRMLSPITKNCVSDSGTSSPLP